MRRAQDEGTGAGGCMSGRHGGVGVHLRVERRGGGMGEGGLRWGGGVTRTRCSLRRSPLAALSCRPVSLPSPPLVGIATCPWNGTKKRRPRAAPRPPVRPTPPPPRPPSLPPTQPPPPPAPSPLRVRPPPQRRGPTRRGGRHRRAPPPRRWPPPPRHRRRQPRRPARRCRPPLPAQRAAHADQAAAATPRRRPRRPAAPARSPPPTAATPLRASARA